MKIYEWIESTKALRLGIEKTDINSNHPIFSEFYGDTILSLWSPIEVITIYKKTYKDFPCYRFGKPVVSRRVKELIEPFTINEIEFLPLLHEELEIYMINVVNVIDCVDYDRSEILLSVGVMAGFRNIVFDYSKIPAGTYFFKIREMADTRVFITESFKEILESFKLKGLDFTKKYDSEFTIEMERQQKQQYEAALSLLENDHGPEFSYEEARAKIETGLAVESGKWRMQPILLDYHWHEIERSTI
ncbi:imm11 family protein [Paenibacillus chibensis]|uniref:imm11 family protein n=1 Tax=Paenibacillus chibensis TaxID=59846 RepID=UPI000FD752EE|nr:DUF1629 domain-containing protein [Paenibacillus chibensis]MEC0369515.1 hypothetical protein [Paenibacillus chibensis]